MKYSRSHSVAWQCTSLEKCSPGNDVTVHGPVSIGSTDSVPCSKVARAQLMIQGVWCCLWLFDRGTRSRHSLLAHAEPLPEMGRPRVWQSSGSGSPGRTSCRSRLCSHQPGQPARLQTGTKCGRKIGSRKPAPLEFDVANERKGCPRSV